MPSSPCRNCGAHLLGAYCHRCGQQHHDDLSLRVLTRRVLEETLDYDGRLLRTLRLLLLRPGLLTALYLHGRRARFVPPVRIFMTASLVFFAAFVVTRPVRHAYMAKIHAERTAAHATSARQTVVSASQLGTSDAGTSDADATASASRSSASRSSVGPSSAPRQAPQRTDAQLEARTQVYANALSVTLALVLPLIVVLLRSLYAGRPWVDHVVFVLHFGAAFLIGFLAFMLVGVGLKLGLSAAEPLIGFPGWLNVNVVLYSVFGAGLLVFLYRSLRRVYGTGRWEAGWRCAVFSLGSFLLYVLATLAAGFYARVIAFG